MTRLEDHYRLHPFPFFVVHMAGIVAFLASIISGIMVMTNPSPDSTAHMVHRISSAALLLLFVAGMAEAVIVKARSAGKGRSNPPFGYRYHALADSGFKRDAVIYAAHSVLSWVVLPLALVVMILSGFPFAGCLHSAHPALGIAFVILVAAHTVLSVPARRIRAETDRRHGPAA